MKNQLIAIEKACFKIEKAMNAYNEKARNIFRTEEVSRAYFAKAYNLYKKLSLQHEEIMKASWDNGVFY